MRTNKNISDKVDGVSLVNGAVTQLSTLFRSGGGRSAASRVHGAVGALNPNTWRCKRLILRLISSSVWRRVQLLCMAAASPARIPVKRLVLEDSDYLQCEWVKRLLTVNLHISWQTVHQLVEAVSQSEKV